MFNGVCQVKNEKKVLFGLFFFAPCAILYPARNRKRHPTQSKTMPEEKALDVEPCLILERLETLTKNTPFNDEIVTMFIRLKAIEQAAIDYHAKHTSLYHIIDTLQFNRVIEFSSETSFARKNLFALISENEN